MRVICSYCQAHIVDKEPLHDPTVSHGMCQPCFDHLIEQETKHSTGRFLDRFDSPVVAVDHEGYVVAINEAMAEQQGIEDRAAAGMLGGDLMECVYAKLPEGCGQTVHCTGCTVRGLVGRTIETEQAQTDVPAYVDTAKGRTHMRLSSYLRDGVVFLMFDQV